MDLLGSILDSMDKPPSMGDKEKKLARERKEQQEKRQKEDRDRKMKFRTKIEKEVNELINDSTKTKRKYEPMDKICRSIVHDVAEVAGLASFSFGESDENRYIMLFKKEFAPSDEELDAYRRGEEYDPVKAKELSKQKAEAEEADRQSAKTSKKFTPASNYRDKYKHLIGEDSAKEAAHDLQPNKQFGEVPSENKKDKRSVEETMNQIRAKKKQRKEEESALNQSESASSSTTNQSESTPSL